MRFKNKKPIKIGKVAFGASFVLLIALSWTIFNDCGAVKRYAAIVNNSINDW